MGERLMEFVVLSHGSGFPGAIWVLEKRTTKLLHLAAFGGGVRRRISNADRRVTHVNDESARRELQRLHQVYNRAQEDWCHTIAFLNSRRVLELQRIMEAAKRAARGAEG